MINEQNLLEKIHILVNEVLILSSEKILSQIIEINQDFLKIPRAFKRANEMTEIKFSLQKMRRVVLNALIKMPIDSFSISAIKELRINLSSEEKELLLKQFNSQLEGPFIDLFTQLGAHQELTHHFSHRHDMASLLKMAGPKKILPMVANRRSRATTKKWMRDHQFSDYQFSEDGVLFKGMELRPGDMILSSVNLDGNGIYTTLVEPKGYAYHFGIFAIVEYAGKRFPIVLETYEIGVRLVPLHQFFSKSFNCYFEAYRLNQVPPQFYTKINQLAMDLPDKVKGYNFDTEDPDHTYLACTSVATYLFKQLELEPIATQSHYSSDTQILKNLDEIELKTGPFLSPWDFIASDRTHCVGFWDNDYFLLNICRELCEKYTENLFKTKQLSLSRAPLLYYFNSFGVKQIQKNTLLGRAIGGIVGFNINNLPNASYKVLAMIEIFEHTMEKCVRKLYQTLKSSDYLNDYKDIRQYAEMKHREVEQSMGPFRRIFKGTIL